jgi:hypothetical protein
MVNQRRGQFGGKADFEIDKRRPIIKINSPLGLFSIVFMALGLALSYFLALLFKFPFSAAAAGK